MGSEPESWDLDELCRRARVSQRTVRYYIQRGLLPSPGVGRGSRYDESYLHRLRKLLFQVEGQMRQAEIEQMELYHAVLDDFQLEVAFPNWGDRVGLQRLFKEHPALVTITEYLEERLSPEECYERLMKLKEPGPQT